MGGDGCTLNCCCTVDDDLLLLATTESCGYWRVSWTAECKNSGTTFRDMIVDDLLPLEAFGGVDILNIFVSLKLPFFVLIMVQTEFDLLTGIVSEDERDEICNERIKG